LRNSFFFFKFYITIIKAPQFIPEYRDELDDEIVNKYKGDYSIKYNMGNLNSLIYILMFY